jgi:hypothetical protein
MVAEMSNTRGKTVAQRNRGIRQEAVREKLAAMGLLQQVIVNIEKFEDFDQELDSIELQRLKAANEHRLKLIDKYLPTVKPVELTGEDGGAIAVTNVQRTVVKHPDS